MADDEDYDDEDEEAPGLWTSFGTALRLIVGWFCVAIGVLNLVVELDRKTGEADGPYLIFHATLLVGGVLLLSLAWIGPRPGVPGYVAGAVTLAAGTVISAIPVVSTVCCMTAFATRHGFPYTFVARNEGQRWHIDSQHLLADLLFWGYVGLIVLLVVSLVRPAPESEPPRHAARHDHAEPRTYIEQPQDQHPRVQQD